MPATRPRPSTRALLGGRWAISLRGWAIGSVLVLVAPLLSLRALPGVTTTELLEIVIAQWLVVSALMLSGHLTVFRHRRIAPVAVGWVVAFAVVLAIGRIAATYAVQHAQAAPSLPASELARIAIAIMPATVIAFVLIVYLLAIEDWYASERERLLRFEVDAEAARLRALGALDATRAVVTDRIREDLESQLAGLESGERLALSDRVLDAASGYVRPESHALWATRTQASRRGRLRELERASLADPLPLLVPFALWLASAVPFAVIRTDLGRTVLATVAVLGGMLVAYPLGRRAIRRYAPAPRFARARLLALTAMLVAALPTLALSQRNAQPGNGLLLALVSVAMVIALTIVVSWTQAGLRVQGDRLRELRSQAEEAEFQRLALEAATEQMQRDLARYLHGTVQAGLVASAYAIQDAAARGDEVALEHAIAEARAAAARVGDPAPVSRDLTAMRAAIDETWQGILAIRWTLPAGELDAAVVDRLGNVVRECLANASIHGAASEAAVSLIADGDAVIVEVGDNGRGPGDGPPGLGSAVLNEATAGNWTIAAADGGTRVRAVVPA
mgnify:CR=1 FL=1